MKTKSGDPQTPKSGSRYRVIPSDGGWAVKSGGHERSTRVYESKAEAIQAATEVVRKKGGELVVQDRDGHLKTSYTLGRDPFAQISAVEGIITTTAAKNRAAEFDRKGLSPEERRNAIVDSHRRRG
jgi:hypothetical protein